MDLSEVSNYMHGSFTPIHTPMSEHANHVYHQLLQSLKMYKVAGKDIYTASATCDFELREFGSIVDVVKQEKGAKLIFGLGVFPKCVLLVARSMERHYLDVGEICRTFGGGGHGCAASARISGSTGIEVEERLFAHIMSMLHHDNVSLLSLVTSPVVTLSSTTTISDASKTFLNCNLKRIPILDKDQRCVGILDRIISEKVKAHGFGDHVVEDYMETDFIVLRVEESPALAFDLLLSSHQRLVPVMDGNKLVGVISRADVVKMLMEDPSRFPVIQRKRENFSNLIHQRIPKEHSQLLALAGEVGDLLNSRVFVVGGFVRDLLLNRPNDDIDLVVEGDGVAFADTLAQKFNGRVTHHAVFLTAVVSLPSGLKIDVCTARLEFYPAPVALPVVELSSLKMDLYRRDFSMNALAMNLNKKNFGEVYDFFSGIEDLRRGRISVLHSLSFIDDPTRIFRAIRFEQRYGFKISAQTDRLIKHAVKLDILSQLSGARLFHEIEKIFCDENPVACWERMKSYHVLDSLHPSFKIKFLPSNLTKAVETKLFWDLLKIHEPNFCLWKYYLHAVLSNFSNQEVLEVLQRLKWQEGNINEFMEWRQTFHKIRNFLKTFQKTGATPNANSELYFTLRNIPMETMVLLLMDFSGQQDQRHVIVNYLTHLRTIKLDITGQDLKGLGLKPGPRFRILLELVLRAKVDGLVGDKESQLSFVRKMIAEQNS
eukprot:TRINITY_DN6248_c0_g1_i4.p1 TRINITY_DN6248_c0_g1~~TRINITY_DN6248_c0_g1_i4.p1  ORF type:complete len:713 (-),score=166.35 TRINITY_DN6248_c0_g1_i4:173-2311(-)